MKRFLYVLVIVICSVATTAYGQSISGKLTTEGWSKSIQISSHEPVSLFKNFRDGKHKILFHFKSTAGEKAIVLFQMKTTLIHNGKTVGSSYRSDWPWLPGDMYVPVEAFDFIPLMQKQANQNKGKLMPGTYEIRLEMKPSEVKSEPIYSCYMLSFL